MSVQIIEADDADFPQLLAEFQRAQEIGRFQRDGKVHIVSASRNFVLIGSESGTGSISIKPTRSMSQAREIALDILDLERVRGSEVKVP